MIYSIVITTIPRVFASLFSKHILVYSILSVNFLIIFWFGDYFLIFTLIIFLLSTSVLLYLIYDYRVFSTRFPTLYKLLLFLSSFVSVITTLVLLYLLPSFYYGLFIKVYTVLIGSSTSGSWSSGWSLFDTTKSSTSYPSGGGGGGPSSGPPSYFNFHGHSRNRRELKLLWDDLMVRQRAISEDLLRRAYPGYTN